MKTYSLILVSVLVFPLLFGCATSFRPWLLSEVTEGMGRDQVLATLGEPEHIEVVGHAEHLHYTYQEDYTPMLGASDFGTMDMNSPFQQKQVDRSLEVYHYVVILAEGKVINYKELSD
jgi:outer membrane protein assembly factor BamE (lipoprotein component of BamABCDE complex)